MKHPIITLTTDFGLSGHYVAAMKGVILGICPASTVVDISHSVAPYSIAEGAWLIGQAWKSFPAGTVHVVVVDPGVGSERRAIVAEVEGRRFVAPDNGVLSLVLDAGRPGRIRHITAARYFVHPVSQTFHGRDIFAPVAARIAGGLAPSRLGPLINDAIRLPLADPRRTTPKSWQGVVLHIDRFGNIVTNFSTAKWPDLANTPFRLRVARINISLTATTYAAMKPGKFFLIAGSSGHWEISCNQRDTATLLSAKPGDILNLRSL